MTLSEEVSGFVIFMGLGMRCLGQLGAEWVVEAAGGDAAAFARVMFRGDSHHSLIQLPWRFETGSALKRLGMDDIV